MAIVYAYDILDILERREAAADSASLAWGGIPISLLMIEAFDASKHEDLKRRLAKIDVDKPRITGTDPRFFGLLTALMVEGRQRENTTRLAKSYQKHPLLAKLGIVEYILGELTEDEFLQSNEWSVRRNAFAEAVIAFSRIGERDRKGALKHLSRAVESECSWHGVHGYVLALHRMLDEDHELVEWIR